MDIFVWPPDIIEWQGKRLRCALGRSGIVANKCEGDGATPEGTLPLRRVMYRPDRIEPPRTALPLRKIDVNDAWCDDPQDPSYNRLVRLPFAARHEILWRREAIYDVVVELGYNDDPVVAGRGSAIFMHIAKPGYPPTEGCIALGLRDLLSLLGDCPENSRLHIAREH